MDQADLNLRNPPIVEAVLDLDCDMPPNFDLSAIEDRAKSAFTSEYPEFHSQFMQERKIAGFDKSEPTMSIARSLQAFRFRSSDQKQLVQARRDGFSFNRLAPYERLDAYLPEIERTWKLFVEVAKPIRIRRVALRYINRIQLPMESGHLALDSYLKSAPHLPMQDELQFVGFVHQHRVQVKATGNMAVIVLASQNPEIDRLPIILDITAIRAEPLDAIEWPPISETVHALRALKNSIFRNTLTERCLNLFQSV